MNEIYNKINEKTNGKYKGVRFPKITFDRAAKMAKVTVVCDKSDVGFVKSNLVELGELIKEICEFNTSVVFDVSSEPPTPASLRAAVVAFTEKFSYVSSMLHTVFAEVEPTPCVRLKMHNAMYDLAKDDYIPRLKEFLLNSYVCEVKLDVQVVDYAKSGATGSAGTVSTKTEYKLGNVVPIIGSLNPTTAKAISTVTERGYNVTLCGIFAMPVPFVSKGGSSYEKFLLYDGDTTIQCVYRPNGGPSLAKPEYINKTVCILGNVEYDGMRQEATLSVREMALCTAEGLSVIPSVPCPKDYAVVRPQSYEVFVQSSMFDGDLQTPPALEGDFVVFDFETTGLSVLHDRPTELGAVKISGGKLKESFSTLIDPRREIPPEVVEKTGITNEMVKGQPLFEDILPDFYKFTYGCSVVCHNIAFDFPFLLRGGNRSGWAFGDRRTFDTMAIAPLAIPGISRLTLDKVLEGLGLVNDNAHRATSDAEATAKAFIAMQRKLSGLA